MNLLDAHLHAPSDQNLFSPDGLYYINAVRQDDWKRITGFAQRNQNVRGFIGIHPWHAAAAESGWEEELCRSLHAVPSMGIGEIGLDACGRNKATVEAQVDVCARQLRIALELERPVSLHCCRAWERLIDVLKLCLAESGKNRIRGLVHRYNGGLPELKILIDLGLCISFHPSIHSANPGQRALLSHCPLDSLLLESDSESGPDHEVLQLHYERTAQWLGISLSSLLHQVVINGSICTNQGSAG
ncbi:TatD family hydrolase [Spirochaeta dissipatitropha]